MSSNRREWLRTAGFGVASAWFGTSPAHAQTPSAELPATALFSPFAFGAKGDGTAKDTAALQQAIDAASAHGGGTVHVPAGRYLCGSLVLKSRVSLWLDNGCTVLMSPDDADFLPFEKLSYDPRANHATADFHHALLTGDGLESVAIFGEGSIESPRPKRGGPKPIALKRCTHVAIRGITLRNAPNYNISLLGCSFVHIDSVTIHNGLADGIDPDCSHYVRISNSFVESRDDAICLKASGSLGERGATEHVVIDNCILRTASIHIKCGTESCGDFRNIAISNCVFEGGMGMSHGNPGLAFYTVDEGSLEGITVSNIAMRNVGTPIAILRGDRDRCGFGKGPGALNSIHISNIVATGAKLFSVIAGLPGAPVCGIRLENISIAIAGVFPGTERYPQTLDAIPEKPKSYPQPIQFGALPAFGLFLRHVSNITLRGVEIASDLPQERYAIVADDVSSLRCAIWQTATQRTLWLNNIRDAYLELGSTVVLSQPICRIGGANTERLYLKASGSVDSARHLLLDPDLLQNAIHLQECSRFS